MSEFFDRLDVVEIAWVIERLVGDPCWSGAPPD
jgi:hypothetical protein